MPRSKDLKLKDALKRHQGVDQRKEHNKKVQKQAEKKKRARQEVEVDEEMLEAAILAVEAEAAKTNGSATKTKDTKSKGSKKSKAEDASEGWETDDSEVEDDDDDDEAPEFDLSRLDDSDSDSEDDEDLELENVQNGALDEDDDEDDDDEDEEDIPLSDLESLASDDKGDIIPHQRLTINNHSALLKAQKSIALPSTLPWSATQSITSAEPIVIADIEDDLQRELGFYKQSLDAVTRARALLKAEGNLFSRPADYFAEMVKSDEHMGKIKKKLVDEAAGKKAAAEARRQRDLRKFGKQVQVAKLQERDKAKKETIEKIGMLKRKRQGADITGTKEDDMFDVALEDAAVTDRKDRADRKAAGGSGRPNAKRQKKDEKYGHGGKKRFAKSNDAKSSADVSGFSVKKMKGKKPQRPGKSKRAKF